MLDTIVLLVVRPIMLEFSALAAGRDERTDFLFGYACRDRVGIVASSASKASSARSGRVDHPVISFAICRHADITGEPAQRSARSVSKVLPFRPAAETRARAMVLYVL